MDEIVKIKKSHEHQKLIFPFDHLDERRKKILKEARNPGFIKKFFCVCCMPQKKRLKIRNLKIGKKSKGTIVNLLEGLFVEYEAQLVEMMWKKKVFTPIERKSLRDDLTYLLPQLV